MKLTVIGSNSFGNCYVLQNANEALLIEAGCKMQDVKKALGWKLQKVAGAIVTHCHNDHAAHIKDYMRNGIRVLALPHIFEEKGIDTLAFRKDIRAGHGYRIGGFGVFAFDVCHDVPCVGYIIDHADMGRMLFVTDTMMLEYTVPGLNHVLLEANYADDILERNIEEGRVPSTMRRRLMDSHMELETTKRILRANDLSAVNEVVLIHISDGNADEERFVRECAAASGKPVYAARAGMELDLSKLPY